MRFLSIFLLLAVVGIFVPYGSAVAGCAQVEKEFSTKDGKLFTRLVEECPTDGDGGTSGSGGAEVHECRTNGEVIPCTRGGAHWNEQHFCYASPTADYDDFRGAENGPWAGRSDGAIYICDGAGPDAVDNGSPLYFWVAVANPPTDGESIARSVLSSMPLVRPSLNLAPTPPQMTYVGLDTWLWIDRGQWVEVAETTSVSSATVRVVATPRRVEWDLGEGTATCASQGQEWVRGSGSAATTDCSYAFTRVSDFEKDGTFGVSAVLTYDVAWTCTGNCLSSSGSLGEASGPVGTSAIRVGERQSVVVR